ncbi:hypothetical protein Btru_072663 [Bulinus truncatus]|nr:hypothetical protein Btru_072663 [Bulinus truncatus]
MTVIFLKFFANVSPNRRLPFALDQSVGHKVLPLIKQLIVVDNVVRDATGLNFKQQDEVPENHRRSTKLKLKVRVVSRLTTNIMRQIKVCLTKAGRTMGSMSTSVERYQYVEVCRIACPMQVQSPTYIYHEKSSLLPISTMRSPVYSFYHEKSSLLPISTMRSPVYTFYHEKSSLLPISTMRSQSLPYIYHEMSNLLPISTMRNLFYNLYLPWEVQSPTYIYHEKSSLLPISTMRSPVSYLTSPISTYEKSSLLAISTM